MTVASNQVFSQDFLDFLNKRTNELSGSQDPKDSDAQNSTLAIRVFVGAVMQDNTISEASLQELVDSAIDERTAIRLSTILTKHEFTPASEAANDAYNTFLEANTHRTIEDVKAVFDDDLGSDIVGAREQNTVEKTTGFNVNQAFNEFPSLLRGFAEEQNITNNTERSDALSSLANPLADPMFVALQREAPAKLHPTDSDINGKPAGKEPDITD